ncbi:hypothetical protein BX070DRAFT_226528 [Coemansia spiralis]|nr:hypothetical protein BX070DRAFT_226528 [Coemansia spiralis]
MKFAAATALLGLVTVAFAQESSSSSLNAFQQCLQSKCPNNTGDVNCQAACSSNPNPNASMIEATNECYKKCNGLGYQEAIDCQTQCNQIYNPTGVVVSNHLTPAGVTAASSSGSSAASSTGSASSTPDANSKSSTGSHASEANSEDEASNEKSNHESGEESDSESGSHHGSSTHESTKTSSASSMKAALSAAAIVAAAALF